MSITNMPDKNYFNQSKTKPKLPIKYLTPILLLALIILMTYMYFSSTREMTLNTDFDAEGNPIEQITKRVLIVIPVGK